MSVYLTHAVLITLLFLVLLLDKFTPVGPAVWLFYYIIAILVFNYTSKKWLIWYSLISSAFIIIGWYISKESEIPVVFSIENRISSIIVLWILVFTFYRNKRLTTSLKNRSVELSNLNRDLESFNYSVSHDLKGPLAVITSYGQILLEDATEKNNSNEIEGLSIIVSEGKHMRGIIDDLLRLSRIERTDIHKADINLSIIASKSAESLKGSFKNSEIIIQPDMKAKGDEGLIRLLFDNLIGNALKFSSFAEKPLIEVGSKLENNQTIYFVKDNGIGFDMAKADKIFDPFVRLHTQSEFKGTGIGLSIVRKIVEKHHGKVWVQSEIGKGTTFFFFFGM